MIDRFTDGKWRGRLAVIEKLKNGDMVLRMYEAGSDEVKKKVDSPSRASLEKMARVWINEGRAK